MNLSCGPGYTLTHYMCTGKSLNERQRVMRAAVMVCSLACLEKL